MKWVNKGELAVGRRREDAAAGGYMRHKSFSLELLAIISPCSTCWVAPLTFLLSVLGQGFCSFGVFGYKILLVFEATSSQRDAWKKLKLPKVGKGCLKLSFFYGSHIDEIVCVEQIGLESAMTLKKYYFLNRISSVFNFTVTS